MFDLSGENKVVQSSADSDNNKPLSWKLSRRGSLTLGRGTMPGTRVGYRNAIKQALTKNKNDTKKIRMEKKKGIDIVYPIAVDEFDEKK